MSNERITVPTKSLSEVIAVYTGIQSRVTRAITDIYQTLDRQKGAEGPFSGLKQTYTPFDEEDKEKLTPDEKIVQIRAWDLGEAFARHLQSLLDAAFTKETGNYSEGAFADVVMNGVVLMEHVPVTFLINLLDKLQHVHSFLSKLPTLDPAVSWRYSADTGLYMAKNPDRFRNVKITEPRVVAPATVQHPAQVKEVMVNQTVGKFEGYSLSGAIPVDRKEAALAKVTAIMDAVKEARERANTAQVQKLEVPDTLLKSIFRELYPTNP